MVVRFFLGTLGMLMTAFGLGILWRPVQTIGVLSVCLGLALSAGYTVMAKIRSSSRTAQ